MRAAADRLAYQGLMVLENHNRAFRLDVECTRNVVLQTANLAEVENRHLIEAVRSAVCNEVQLDTESDTW